MNLLLHLNQIVDTIKMHWKMFYFLYYFFITQLL